MKNHKHIAIPGGHVTWEGKELPTEEVMSSILSLVEAAKNKVSKDPTTPNFIPPAWRGKPKFINQNKCDHDYQPVELDSKQLANHSINQVIQYRWKNVSGRFTTQMLRTGWNRKE